MPAALLLVGFFDEKIRLLNKGCPGGGSRVLG